MAYSLGLESQFWVLGVSHQFFMATRLEVPLFLQSWTGKNAVLVCGGKIYQVS